MDLFVDRPVSIQVGGKTFATRLSTLRKYPEALLWKAYTFNHKNFDLVFWDRNPYVFGCLLEFYRTNRLSLPMDLGLTVVQEELQFWGFDVEPPDRPPWPVLPGYHASSTRAPDDVCLENTIQYPLGMALREASSGCHCVLVCLIWSAIGRCPAVWQAAQQGYRSISIYWKTRAPGVDSTLLKSHKKELQNLADMDGCKVDFFPESTTTSALSVDSRTHDVYTHGHLTSLAPVRFVAEWKFQVSYHKEGHEVVLRSTSEDKIHTTFVHQGFRVHLYVQDDRVWWYMNPVHCGVETTGTMKDVRALEDARGFILVVSFVVGTTLLRGFTMPSCYYRNHNLRSDAFMAQTYTDVQEAGWYKSEKRHDMPYETRPFDFSLDDHHFAQGADHRARTEMTLLVEEKQDVRLVCHPVSNLIPFSSSVPFAPCAYDKIRIEW